MQRVILDPEWILPRDLICDHEDGDTLNNQRYNIKLVTYEKSNRNRRMRSDNTSGYRGVSYINKDKKYKVKIKANGRIFCGGYHHTAEDAARAYNALAILHHGEDAKLNTISE